MNPGPDCERVRHELMAALDGEAMPPVADPRADGREHLARCSACGKWLQDLESMNSRFHVVSYPGEDVDLWPTVRGRLQQSNAGQPLTYWLGLLGALVVGWRALQLLIPLPLPVLHPIVPLAGAIVALWLMAHDPLAIETFAPELEKRGT